LDNNEIDRFVQLNDTERFRQYYKKHDICDFFKVLGNDVTELRFVKSKDDKIDSFGYAEVKSVATMFNIPHRGMSLFIEDPKILKIIMGVSVNGKKLRRNNIYYSVNPREKGMIQDKSGKIFEDYGKKKELTKSINNLLIDIDIDDKNLDRANKIKKCLQISESILSMFKKKYMIDSYARIISGNGVQLIIPLSPIYKSGISIELAEIDNEMKVIEKATPQFERWRYLIKKGFGKELKQWFSTKKVILDDSVFDVARVTRLPLTYNVKKSDNVHLCGIIDMQMGPRSNVLTNIINNYTIALPRQRRQTKVQLTEFSKIDQKNPFSHPLINMLTTSKLPEGNRHHYLELSMIFLLRDNGYDFRKMFNFEYPELNPVLDRIKSVQGRGLNVPSAYDLPNGHFNTETVNIWCINNNMTPVFPVLSIYSRHRIIEYDIKEFKNELNIQVPKELSEQLDRFDYHLLKRLVGYFKWEWVEDELGEFETSTNHVLKRLLETVDLSKLRKYVDLNVLDGLLRVKYKYSPISFEDSVM